MSERLRHDKCDYLSRKELESTTIQYRLQIAMSANVTCCID